MTDQALIGNVQHQRWAASGKQQAANGGKGWQQGGSRVELHSSRRADQELKYKLKAKYRCWVYYNENNFKSYVTILYSVWSMFDHWKYILPMLPLSFSEKEN